MVDHWTVKVGGGEPETVVQNLNQYLHELSFGLMGPTEVVLYTTEEATVSIQTAGHADFETIPDGVVVRGELVEATVTAAAVVEGRGVALFSASGVFASAGFAAVLLLLPLPLSSVADARLLNSSVTLPDAVTLKFFVCSRAV